ncbi:MAG: GNAT family N-acetyltransferase [Campylobacteraceae bacterium]|jgi:putative acetyltransferase|nr:GNAT family N-acetyltransferase [Campylobacteraceae bacterium]
MTVKNILSTTEYEKIIFIWEKSVKATHHFLSDDDILEIKADVIKYLPRLKVYAYKNANGEMLGFIAIDKNKIEMLFVSPEYFGKGIGGALVDFALKDMHVDEVDVNEQNANAREFYEHMGFKVTARLEKDNEGRAFPLLRMKNNM